MATASIIIPAHNEAAYIEDCLDALLAAHPVMDVEVIVAANACTDETVELAQHYGHLFSMRAWTLQVLDIETPGKLNALNQADAICTGETRIYLDADVTVSPGLIPQLIASLDQAEPRYASGRPHVTSQGNWIVRTYTRFWARLPFVRKGVPGFGLFAVNAAGRRRWGSFPDIISDDTYVRWQFAPKERIRVDDSYDWPMIDTLSGLIRVRRRQDIGVAEVVQQFPDLKKNSASTRWRRLGIFVQVLRDPVGFLVYGMVSLAVRLPIYRAEERWVRGR